MGTLYTWKTRLVGMVGLLAVGGGGVTARGQEAPAKPQPPLDSWLRVHAAPATYYVDATAGDDAAAGTSPQTAWKTLARVAKAELADGDAVLLRRGATFRETLTPPRGGRAGWPIRFGAYGEGAPPRISGADPVRDFAPVAAGNDATYSADLAAEPNDVYEGETPLARQETAETVAATPGSWCWGKADKTLRVHCTDSKPPGSRIEAVVRRYGVHRNGGADHVIVEDLRVERVADTGIYSRDNHYWIVRRCTVRDVGLRGVMIAGNASTRTPARGCRVEQNRIERIRRYKPQAPQAAGIMAYGTDSAAIVENHIRPVVGFGVVAHCAGQSGRGATSINDTIARNEIVDAGEGGINVMGCEGTRVVANHIHHGKGMGIGVNYGSDRAYLANNLIHDLAESDDGTHYNGIDINVNANHGVCVHNTVRAVGRFCFTIEDYRGLACQRWVVANNVFDARGNVPQGAAIQVFPKVTQLTLRNNLYWAPPGFPGAMRWLKGAKSFRDSLYNDMDRWSALSGDTGSIVAEPKFVDAEAGDLRLAPNSPAIDAGTDMHVPRDIAGRPRPTGEAPDLGAWERPADSR